MLRLELVRHNPVKQLLVLRGVGRKRLYWVYSYIFNGLMVDTGPPVAGFQMAQAAREFGVKVAVATHHHEDHAGAGWWLSRFAGVHVMAPRAALGILSSYYRLPLYRRLLWGVPEPVRAEPLPEELEAGELRLKVLAIPGHSPDHIALLEAERGWVFTGDTFLSEHLCYLRATDDLAALIGSLELLASYEPELLFCAHGGIVRGAADAIRRKLAFLRERWEVCWALASRGLTVPEITARVCGPDGKLRTISMGSFSKENLVKKMLEMEVWPLRRSS